MAEDIVQPPRYTSTPLANRNTSNILNNFIEVSPIFSTPEKVKKAKSLIPVLTINEIRARSNGVRSIGAKTKVSTSNGTGQGSSGSVKIPFQISKVEAEKMNIFNKAQVSKKSSTEVFPPGPRAVPQSARRNTIDQAIESVIQSLSQKETKTISKESLVGAIESVVQSLSQKETKTTPKESHVGAVPTKTPVKTQVPKAVPEEKPQNGVDEVSTKHLTQTKPQVLKAVSAKEPRNSVDEVIDSVIGSQTRKETETSQGFDAQDVPQTKSSRVSKMSKISQRPSTLPSVPEDAPIGGTGQLSEDCIFKRLETQNGWLIPKETKTRVSLKRKSSVPLTVTKRNKKIESKPNQDDESLFDSPEVPNLVEVSSLCNKRQTYVVKKKTEITDIPEERHESVTDGIIPLERLSQKSSLTNVSVKSTQRDSKKKPQTTITRKNIEEIREEIAPKDKLEDRDGGKENIEQYVSPKVYKNKRTLTKQPENQSEECVNIESSNSNTESLVKSIAKDNKPIKSNKVLGQEINTSEQSSQQLEVDITAHQSKETKKKNIKSKKKETNFGQNQNTESLNNDTGPRRTLRERKPNAQYVDTFQINSNYTKEIDRKKKKVLTVKSSQGQKENSYEPPVENKSQRKKTVKGNKKSVVNTEPNDLVLQHHSKGPEETGYDKTLNRPINLNSEKGSENVENTALKNISDGNECTDNNNKKESENKKKIKKVTKKNVEIPVEEVEEQINRGNLYKEKYCQQNTSKRDITATNTNKKAQPKKQISLAYDDGKQTNEANVESQNAGSLTDNEHLKLVLHGTSSLKSTSNDKTRSGASPETKNRRKTVSKTSSAKHVNDDNQLMKAAEEDAFGNNQSTRRERSKQFVEEKDQIRRKTTGVINKHSSKSQSRVTPKSSDVHEHTMADKSNKLHEDGNCTEKESCVSYSGRKRKSEDRECDVSHSESRFYFRERKQAPVQFWKNQTGYSHILNYESMSESALKKRKYEDRNSGKVNNAERGFSIKDLFGMHEVHTQELQPGVVAARSIHIHNFVMMGEVSLEPGATLSKISTNTTYSVQEGTACVTIKKHTKYFNANDVHRRFFIPKNVDVSITNAGNLPLKMEFVKFRG